MYVAITIQSTYDGIDDSTAEAISQAGCDLNDAIQDIVNFGDSDGTLGKKIVTSRDFILNNLRPQGGKE